MQMRAQLRPAIVAIAVFSVLTGFLYPLAVTGIAQVLFPNQANGSLILKDGEVLGSELIGQPFTDPRYFWSRPSATAPFAYNAAASSGSNLGPSNPALAESIQARISALMLEDPHASLPVPVDLVTASASGLDPHISLAAALYQVSRVAMARGLDEATVRQQVAQYTDGRQIGVLGEPHVNVLKLNLALDEIK
jgi:potassium-transporting ATPase KdpC subunit